MQAEGTLSSKSGWTKPSNSTTFKQDEKPVLCFIMQVFNVDWTTDHRNFEFTGVSMTIRAETNTHVVTFHTFWNRPRGQDWKLLKVLDVRVVSKN
jgi:hypothetical protein